MFWVFSYLFFLLFQASTSQTDAMETKELQEVGKIIIKTTEKVLEVKIVRNSNKQNVNNNEPRADFCAMAIKFTFIAFLTFVILALIVILAANALKDAVAHSKIPKLIDHYLANDMTIDGSSRENN